MHQVFSCPFSAVIAGPSGCGKSSLVAQLIAQSDEMFGPNAKFYWFYGSYQPLFTELKKKFGDKVQFIEGVPTIEMIDKIASQRIANEPITLLLDDLMSSCVNSETIANIFTKDSHHRQLCVFLLCQNLFVQGKFSRTISLNSHYLFLFSNPRDRAQIRHLSYQMYPDNPKFLTAAYRDATCNNGYSYLFLDLKQDTPDDLRVKTKILPSDEVNIVYCPK